MDKILENLTNLLIAAKNNLVGAIIVAIIAMFVFGGTQLWTTLDKVAQHFPTSQIESERFNKQLIAQREISDLLELNRKDLNGDRIGVRQFHNGRTDLTGLPFTSVSTTYVRTRQGVDFPQYGYNAVPLSTMNDVLLQMWDNPRRPHCASFLTTDLEGSYHTYVAGMGIYKYYACPIVNLQGWPVGIIGISYMDKDTQHPTDEVIFNTLRVTSDKVSGYLLTVSDDKKNPWYSFK